MPLTIGAKLGPYEVVAPLGAGGMGEVYRAKDTRLGREVALKILPAELANDPSRRARFEQEARAVAALNHPNIVAVYDVGEGYIVSELVDGEPLRSGKLGLRKTIDVAAQIAGGLAAAHEAGIVHRDLKPDNILLTRDGRPKILDFGLAKMRSKSTLTDETQTVRTEAGVVMGTVGYMSPEQVRGLSTDHRSDIFSFGLIVHELLTGKRAFQGETSVDTMQAILRQEAPELPETVPAGLRQVVGHCLEKDAGERFQSARDLRFALLSLSQSGSHPSLAPVRSLRGRWILPAVAAMAGAAIAWLYLREPPRTVWIGSMLGASEVVANSPRISPDGTTLAFLTEEGPFAQVAVMKTQTGDRAILTHDTTTGYTNFLSWSPDGSRIYYGRSTASSTPVGVFSVPALGGEERLVLESAEDPEALPDGSLLVVRQNAGRQLQLFRFWPDSGKLQPFPLVGVAGQIRSLPGGREAVVMGARLEPAGGAGTESGSHLYVVNLESGAIRRLPHGTLSDSVIGGFVPAREGKTVFAVADDGTAITVVAIPIAGGSVRTLFALTAKTSGLEAGPDGALYLDQSAGNSDILLFAADGSGWETLAEFPALNGNTFGLLPGGRPVVDLSVGGKHRLMVLEKGKAPAALAATQEETALPLTAVGATQAAILLGPEPHHTIALLNVSTGSIARRIPFDKGPITSLSASPDGKVIYCAAGGLVWAIPLSGGDPRKLHAGDSVAVDPNGQFLLVQLQEAPVNRWIRVPLDGSPEREVIFGANLTPTNHLLPSAVSRDGRVVTPLASTSDYWPPGLMDAAGHLRQMPLDPNRYLDFQAMAWTPDGKIMALADEYRVTLWKFQPQKENR